MSMCLVVAARFFDKDGNKISVPAPPDGNGKPWLYDMVADMAKEIGRHFDYVQWPPSGKALGGSGAGCDGYGCYDPRDLGSKQQQGSRETRFGSDESFRRAIACLRRNGVKSFLDVVLHQLMGENGGPGVFRYLGADGKTLNGRGATTPGWFRGDTGNNDPAPPFCKQDDVPNKYFDYAFGREKSYQHCEPHRVTIDDALDYGDWLFRTTGAVGARFDDVKGTWSPFVAEFMNSRAMADKEFYSEYFDANPSVLNGWANTSPMNGRSGVEDFGNHFAVQAACDGGNAQVLNGAGFTTWRADQSYVFVDSPDTDTSPGQQVIGSKLLAYAFLATIPSRMFLVYGKDYFGSDVWPGAYGLKSFINNLCYVHRAYAYGATVTQFVDDKVIVLNRDGNGGPVGNSGGLLTALNFDTWNHRTIHCPTTFGAHVELHDATGRHPNIRTDANGWAQFTVPSNAFGNGQSYLCFIRADENPEIAEPFHPTVQTFFGYEDLDTKAATQTGSTVSRIWCDAHTTVGLNKESGQGVHFSVTDEAGGEIVPRGHWRGRTERKGWHTLTAFSATSDSVAYTVAVSYTASATL